MSVNKVIVIGNLGANPDIRALPSGQNVANFSLATTERFTDRNGAKQERTEWHRVVAFGRLADTCERFLSKGRQVYVEGRLTTRQYEAKDGSGKRYRTEIVARQLRLLGKRRTATRPRPKLPTTSPFSSAHHGRAAKAVLPQPSKRQSEITEMDIYAIVTEKIINLLENGVVPWRRPWTSTGLPRNLVSKKPYQRHQLFSAFRVKIRVALLVDVPPGNRTGRPCAQRRGEHDRSFLEGRRPEAERRRPRHRGEQREESAPIPSAILSPVQPRTMRTAASGPRQAAEDRNARARSDRSSRADHRRTCRTRPRFSTPDQRRSTAASPIGSPCPRASSSSAPKSKWPRPTTR